MPGKKMLPLTPHQVEFLWLVMQDYIDVTADNNVRRDATNIQKSLVRHCMVSVDRSKAT
jgi:hypothetical protein